MKKKAETVEESVSDGTKAKKTSLTWEMVEEKLAKLREAGDITRVYTTASGAPEIALHMTGNAKVIPADKDYIVYSNGEIVDI